MRLPSNKNKQLSVYEHFGFTVTNTVGKELIGSCPFCLKDNHFYVSNITAAFSCKKCGKEGSWREFLWECYNHYQITDNNLYKQLMQQRGIPLPTLKEWKFAYYNGKYFLPAYNINSEVTDLRLWKKGGKEHSLKGGNVGIVNVPAIEESDTIYICEAYFTALALDWLLKRTGEKGTVISTCGANTFREDWMYLFNNKHVVIVYDHDDAGYGSKQGLKATGSHKVASRLSSSAKSIQFVTWPNKYKKGYDVRDFIIENKEAPNKAIKLFKSFIGKHRDETRIKLVDKTKLKRISDVSLSSIKSIASKSIRFNRNLDQGLILSLATAISKGMPGDCPVWSFLVGPPGSGKTLLLSMFESSRQVIWESTLSPTALISGWGLGRGNAVDPSILARVNNKCLVLKDFTEVLSKNEHEREEVFGIMRGAYDGRVSKPFGTGTRTYICKFSTLAGVTHEIKAYSHTPLGERFLRYNIKGSEDEDDVLSQAMDMQIFRNQRNEGLNQTVSDFLEKDWNFEPDHLTTLVPNWLKPRLNPLSKLLVRLRAGVTRVERGARMGSVAYKPVTEKPFRVAGQLFNLAMCLALVQDKKLVDEDDYNLIGQVVNDTVESYAVDILRLLIQNGGKLDRNTIKTKLKIRDLRYYLEDLDLLEMIDRNGSEQVYVSKIINDLWKRSGLKI